MVRQLASFAGALVLLVAASCSSNQSARDTAADTAADTAKAREEKQHVISELSNRYNVASDWDKLPEPKSSLSVQRTLIRPDSRPTLFNVSLNDIREADGKYVILFSDVLGELKLETSATPDQAERALTKHVRQDFIVVVEVSTVQKASVKVTGFSDEERSYVDVSPITDLFIVKGRLLDFSDLK